MPQLTEEREAYRAAFEEASGEFSSGPASWFAPVRREAIARFGDLGFPTTRLEHWKHTSVRPIAGTAFDVRPRPPRNGLRRADLDELLPGAAEAPVLVFLNGRLAPQLSRTDRLPGGVTLGSLSDALAGRRDEVEPHLARLAAFESHPFTALNTAFLRDGAYVRIPDGVVLERPIHLLYLSRPGGRPEASHPRNLIVCGRGGQAAIVEWYAGAGGGGYLTNAVTELLAADGAVVEHYRIQREHPEAYHVATVEARVGRSAAFTSHAIALGAALSRVDLNARLADEGADATLNGLYVLRGSQHADSHTLIEHAKPHGSSRETYKGVLDGKSRGVFDGRIIVRPDAQKTDARQVNNNLILSDQALVNTTPRLEIFADDVKCTHAATIGQLDQDVLFYVRSRGLDAAAARSLLIQGFVGDVLGRMRLGEIRSALEGILLRRLAGAPEEALR